MRGSKRDRMPFGAASLTNDPGAERAERRASRRALAITLGAVITVGGLLAYGAGLAGSDSAEVAAWRDVVRSRALFDETANLVVALPFDEISRLDGQAIVLDGAPVDGADFRVDLQVSDAPSGLRIHAILIDNRTHEALKDFVAFRSRS